MLYPNAYSRKLLIDQYDLASYDLLGAGHKFLIVDEFVDQELMLEQKARIEAFLNQGNILVFCGHLFIQLIFQNPDRSMNPYWRVKENIAEPMRLSGYSKKQAYAEVEKLLAKVKLSTDYMDRSPAECSGGQKQRIAIARALSMSPQLLVADEITSALDPSTEEEILELLSTLQRSEGMSILYITHRIETISGFADQVAVMKDGAIQEIGNTNAVFANPKSDYTRALLKASSYSLTDLSLEPAK
ncbi:ATP-binding cassette domain-containing protein [Cohnella sp. WQ 127256]|uniref:ATP-binding cassette domain-containing protein n=1 Tax=Cohnella sp. WQ 127256 TaxID=2938790 RepID=UPI00211985D8|nr:ATP-binding cassette domain-containing protein [Cohnella sp. WQ 127256]